MKYPHNIIMLGAFYPAGTEVPVGETPKEEPKVENIDSSVVDTTEVIEPTAAKPKYSVKALKTMSKADLEKVAAEYGIGKSFKTKVDLVTEILNKMGE